MPKVLRRGCKRCFGPSAPKSSCTGARESCTGAKQGFGGAKDSWETFAQRGPKHLLHPLLSTLGTFEVSGPCSRHPGSQLLSLNCLAIALTAGGYFESGKMTSLVVERQFSAGT